MPALDKNQSSWKQKQQKSTKTLVLPMFQQTACKVQKIVKRQIFYIKKLSHTNTPVNTLPRGHESGINLPNLQKQTQNWRNRSTNTWQKSMMTTTTTTTKTRSVDSRQSNEDQKRRAKKKPNGPSQQIQNMKSKRRIQTEGSNRERENHNARQSTNKKWQKSRTERETSIKSKHKRTKRKQEKKNKERKW